ncbi:uncharacterized protein LY79DRAFT_523222 [Colletotrichum navitas]|uniref:Zn(2)-C6 fungal-type domain-containing protein n=1 Tax=Colletotrichum navitas TaxID=681940 RepID=A0AAD8UZC3_9PEZI|nr:uncharacterized protein LY79DRAFT_523222 [Colletotrichum navitas]KAK1574781.1 hypothetical protein LY79DRAFT_523222 [Colletotrichum navitas]
MSIRRESCEPCFRGRRKCDLAYPVCQRCQQTNKACHYVYSPPLARGKTAGAVHPGALPTTAEMDTLDHGDGMNQLAKLQHPTVPRTLGMLGNSQQMLSPADSRWDFYQFRESPRTFAEQAKTMFIHPGLFHSTLPLPLRTAFGICAGAISMNEHTRKVLFKVIAAEVSGMLSLTVGITLLGNLARLQATVLYQMIRFFKGGLEERVLAERQEFVVRCYALKLLQRADHELPAVQPRWEAWVLAESIRRTAVVAFKQYSLYWIFKYGTCIERRGLFMLPVSTKPYAWASRKIYLRHEDRDHTTTYGEFRNTWAAAPRDDVDEFEKMLLMSCNGMEDFRVLLDCPNPEG